MTDKTQVIVEQALKLSPNERAEVAEQLIASLDEALDTGVEQAWQEEVQRRLGQIERGEVKMIPWEEVQRRLRHGK
ncbi:MAG: addiction module antitoxin RelB [Nitrospira sp. WS110]|nr:addiction module antitoxin RelB [Nitrospira sp. WS110]